MPLWHDCVFTGLSSSILPKLLFFPVLFILSVPTSSSISFIFIYFFFFKKNHIWVWEREWHVCRVPACNTSTQALSGEAGGSWVWSEPGLHSLLLLKEWEDRACLSIAGHEGWQNASPSPQLLHQAIVLKATSTSDFFGFMTSLCLPLQLIFKSWRPDCCHDMMSVTAQWSTLLLFRLF